ncbi:tRNA threonylcarbamoyl adenosine modification protein YjeE [Okibacterium sp. HSC-33S16]|uniref:tRNA (adenosine(37)-N6)-threonylcarbamoyltransferase complex ATPase subunit type 1 TsaE n=1 Tax=Okibacterium sp. HSC-33S16 TaxID=2910965 RepID=UPI0020A1AC7C|nr:tRNA (adenosine(37)-N6)-threonylcarbamoyltransferase complex ATPase subunit type 1 TsaE [Okibacterium sp. HSC-33S16]MCP2030049.1 tRNA threonylcarbamoyl adenosine modification protein YjeE [Okibacterium sp. HSC-33S16]
MIELPFDGTVATADDMHDLGVGLGASLHAGDLLVLTGPLGAGKTTLTRGIGEGLGVRGPVTSPTFVLARTHPSLTDGPPLVHVDAYRLSSPLELDDLDIDFAGSVVIVEWGRGMLDGIASTWLDIEIERPTGASDTRSTSGMSADASGSVTDDASVDTVVDNDEPRRVRISRHEAPATA